MVTIIVEDFRPRIEMRILFVIFSNASTCWYWLPASIEAIVLIRRQMLSHFPTVTQSAGFQPEPLIITMLIAHNPSLRLRLEAYTFSNRGRSLRKADSQSAGWKPVPK